MSPSAALVIAGALILATAAAGFAISKAEGRRRAPTGDRITPADLPDGLPLQGTLLVQFSTEMCARCPGVRRLLRSIASQSPHVTHTEIDLTHRPDLARRYRVLSTPTTLVVDQRGAVLARFIGIPQHAALEAALSPSPGMEKR